MNLNVNKVYINESSEGNDIIRKKWLYYQDIDSIEEALHNKQYSIILLKSGESITVNESIITLYSRIKTVEEDEKTKRIIE